MLATPRTPTLVGRSSSSFTRVARIFAAELGVECSFRVVPDLLSTNPADYADNPALRLPILETHAGSWFGTLNICRELSRLSPLGRRVIWPEDLQHPLPCNAHEFVAQAMTTEVALIMAGMTRGGAQPQPGKQEASLRNLLLWLNGNIDTALAALPIRDLSYLEVTLFCLVTHLEFRNVTPVSPYPALNEFCKRFSLRRSANDSVFHFDA